VGQDGDRRDDHPQADPLIALRRSLAERLAALRGEPVDALPAPLLDIVVGRVSLPGGDVYIVRPADWEALRKEEGAASRPIPFWATLWPSASVLARELALEPPERGAQVLELGCGLALPSIVAARDGAEVLATDGASDAVAFAAHALALNEVEANVARADWVEHADALAARGPWDLVLASDVLYTRANVQAALKLLPRLVTAGGDVRVADPGRTGGRDFLAAARATFRVQTRRLGEVALHTLRRR
jgi:predicted nicotinamide N-methyase